MKVYLAGPITGLTYADGQDWRSKAKAALANRNIDGFSPLRAKEYLAGHGPLQGAYDEFPLSTAKGIVARDRNDVLTADLVIFNLLGAKRISIGTCIEFGWADAFRKPSIVVIEKEGNCHSHPMVEALSPFIVDNVEDAVDLAAMILKP
jgi:nucleoside 2-deoxyribosyltransferase